MEDLVKIGWPREGVALITLTDVAPQHNLTCKEVSQPADALEKARMGGACAVGIGFRGAGPLVRACLSG
jgi:hypothetical protein